MDILTTGLAAPVALAAVALIGYLVGYRQRQQAGAASAAQREAVFRKLEQTRELIAKVESISDQLRRTMATHHCAMTQYREQIQVLSQRHFPETDPTHHMHLQEMLDPAQRLTDDIAHAYDELRQRSRELERLRRW